MRKNISSLMTSKNILIALTVLCCFFIGTSFFTDTLTKPLKKCVSMVVVPVQKGMNNIGFWVYDKYQTLQEISVVLDENKKLQSQVDDLTEENNQLKQDSYELNRLRDLYELDQQYAGYSKVGARVIEVTTDNWHSSFKIDKGTAERPRLAVFRSNNHMYAQIIDDTVGKTLVSASTLDKEVKAELEKTNNVEAAAAVGTVVAKRALEKGIKTVVYDRGGFIYAGKIKALAEAAREAGLEF
mgnify:CR=1 FL=1